MDSDIELGHGAISKIRFDEGAVSLIARAFGVESGLAPFRLPSGAVHQIMVEVDAGKPLVMLTLWPTIRRVDAVAQGVTVVATKIAGVEIVNGVEVLFRRDSGEYLIVTRQGKVIVRA